MHLVTSMRQILFSPGGGGGQRGGVEKEGAARGAEREGAGEGRGGDRERGERGGERLPLNWTLTGG